MKRSIVFLILISSLLILSNEFFIQSKATTTTNSQKIGLESQWGIGYIVGSGDTVPLIGFNEPDVSINNGNHFVAKKNIDYDLHKGTINIHTQKLEDLYFVFRSEEHTSELQSHSSS
jgi:hypothetical protein